MTLDRDRAVARPEARKLTLVLAAAVLASGLLAIAAPAASAAGLGPASRLGSPGSAPSVALTPAGDGFAVWTGPHDGGRGVYGRRVDAVGRPRSGVVRLSGPTADAVVGRPAVTFIAATGRFLVAWTGAGAGVRHRSVSGTGAPLGSGPASFTDAGPYAPCRDLSSFGTGGAAALATLASGESLLVWVCAEDTYTSSVVGRRFSRDGAPAGATFSVGDAGHTGAYGELQPAVAANPRTNEYLVAYAAGLLRDPAVTVARRVGADGRVRSEATVSGSGAAVQAAATAHPNGDYLVAWADGEGRVLAERLTPSGAPVRSDDVVVMDGTAATTVAATVNARTGQYTVAGGGARGVSARPIAPDGRPLEAGATTVATTATTAVAAASSPVVTGFLFAWGAPDDGGPVEARGMGGAVR